MPPKMLSIFGRDGSSPIPEFDSLCKSLFLNSYRDAAFGRLDSWKKTPQKLVSHWYCCWINFHATCSATPPEHLRLTLKHARSAAMLLHPDSIANCHQSCGCFSICPSNTVKICTIKWNRYASPSF